MQRLKISKRIIIVRGPTKTKNQVTFGSNFDPDLDSQHVGFPVYKKGAIWHVYIHFECRYNKPS